MPGSGMVAGADVVVANDESTSAGSGMKLALYNADKATLTLPALPVLGSTTVPYRVEHPCPQSDIDTMQAARLTILRDAARRANAYGGAVVAYVQANAIVTVTPATAGLQRLPGTLSAGTPTDAPASPVVLAVT